jgi:hypothetical protein
MTNKEAIKIFENKKVRSMWDSDAEKWYISVVDVIEALTESPNPRKYWSVLKTRMKKEGSELATNCSQLKMQSADGKFYKTDVADVEQLFRLVQSIPSPKAERTDKSRYINIPMCFEQKSSHLLRETLIQRIYKNSIICQTK